MKILIQTSIILCTKFQNWLGSKFWASKTALATILLGFLFVGGASLRAQEGSENGWFVSASPLIFGASKIETKTTITAGGGEVVGDLTADIRTTVE